MPLTVKGRKIKAAMTKEYGGKKGESIFYASRNAGKISGVDQAMDEMTRQDDPNKVGDVPTPFNRDAKFTRLKRNANWQKVKPSLSTWRDSMVSEFAGEKPGVSSGYDERQFTLGTLFGATQTRDAKRIKRAKIADAMRSIARDKLPRTVIADAVAKLRTSRK